MKTILLFILLFLMFGWVGVAFAGVAMAVIIDVMIRLFPYYWPGIVAFGLIMYGASRKKSVPPVKEDVV